jgi:RND superfamily putative drug exporter
MSTLARWCFVHRRTVVIGWIVSAVVILGVSSAVSSNYSMSFSLPNTDSQSAVNLLKANFKAVSGESDQVVIQTTGAHTVTSPQVKSEIGAALAKVAEVPGIASVVSPYTTAGKAQISKSGKVAFATVVWNRQAANVTKTDAKALIAAADTGQAKGVNVYLGGSSIQQEEMTGPGVSVVVGVVAALIVLLIVFYGAFISALMPLLATIFSLAIGLGLIGLLSRIASVPTFASDLAVLIGLGVGVDYGLFIVSRHRTGVLAGMSYEDAVAKAVSTSGRTVLFAGATVCIALLGQLALGISFLNGLAIAAAIAVALTMLAALTFLPAVLGMLGPRVLSRWERRLNLKRPEASGFWLHWSSVIERFRLPVSIASVALVIIIALPILSLRLGNADASSDPSSSTTYKAYETLASGFGAGFNGPLQIVGELSSSKSTAAFNRLLAETANQPGIKAVTSPRLSPNHKVALAVVYPTTSPQAKQTENLVNHIRDDITPPLEKNTGLTVHIGGATATNIDFSKVLTDKLPVFIAVVVVLAFILLTAVFRSLVIPLVAAILNLLSIGAALGALNAVFNLGWLKGLFGVSTTGPISSFLPVLTFSVLFGLSMDYEVYLVSRMQEEWHRLRREGTGDPVQDNHQAIEIGQGKSGRVIAAAASIMILVFGSFILSDQLVLKEFGFGLAFSVLVDALIIRSIFVPAIMHVIGPANWYIPAWLDRILPNLSVDAEEHEPEEPVTA